MFFFFHGRHGNGGIILTREPEIIIVTYIYVPWAPWHICCDIYIHPVGFKGLNEWKYHLCKSRKRRLVGAMKSLSTIHFNWFNIIHFKLILVILLFSLYFLRQILTAATVCYLIYFQSLCNGASVNMFYQKR